MAQASSFEHRRPQRPGGMGRGAMMALLVHAGLLIALAFGVRWRSSEPAGTSAELWASVPQAAAPAAAEPPPAPLPKPLPKVEVKPVEAPPPPPKPEVREADIALEKQAKAEKAQREREEIEQAQKLQRERAERQEREKADKEKREKAEQQRKQEEQLAKVREENLRRITGQAGATGAPQSTGTAQREAGPSANYAARIGALIKQNLRDFQDVPVGTRAEVDVRAAPDGTILGRRLVKSSGNKEWDEQVLQAIDRTETLPKDENGRVPASIPIGFTR